MPTKTQLVVRRGEAVAAAAREQADITASGAPLSIRGLPPAAKATESAAEALGLMYERWAADAKPEDPLLARAVRELAGALRAAADQSRAVRAEAEEAIRSLADEEAQP
jgi:hypothetical protein